MDLPLLAALRDDGSIDPATDPGLSREELVYLYEKMVLLRDLDEKALRLQRAGRIGFYVPCAGQEASEVGAGYAIGEGDWVFPSYRDHGVAHMRGYPLLSIFGQLFGNTSDATRGRQMPNHWCDRALRVVSVSSPVATQVPQAVGAAYAAKLRGERVAVISFFGDGGTSTGDFHAGLNFAGVYVTPNVFFCNNNQYAISLPFARQTATGDIAAKAAAYGFPGVRVDGNDVLAVVKATRDALERARAGGGPSLIEAVTYRMGPHSSSDDPSRYRSEEEVDAWKGKDPIERFGRALERQGLLDAAARAQILEEAHAEVRRAVDACQAAGPVPPESLVEDVYAEMPWHLAEQRARLVRGGSAR